MNINEIELKNFKKFRNFKVACGPRNVLTGKNNAGKSSILDALRVVHDVLRVAKRRVPKLSSFGGRRCASFSLPTTTIKIPIDNVAWNYSDEPAFVRVGLENGSELGSGPINVLEAARAA